VIGIRNQVLFTLVIIAAAAVATLGFVGFAPNRLLSGRPMALWAAVDTPYIAGISLVGATLLALCFASPSRLVLSIEGWLAAALLVLVLASAGEAASALAAGARPAARISLGGAFWMLAACAALAAVDASQRLGRGPGEQMFAVGIIAACAAGLALAGAFDALSIAREYATRRQLFAEAVVRHMELVAGAVGPAIAIGFPLGVAAVRNPRLQGSLFAVLNTLQTIPSIALFGLLIVPLTALGVGGIGMAPAIIALVLYALLPVVRNTVAGLSGVDAAVIDAARGMGLTSGQIFRQVELPLALPVFLAGLRIVVVQAIGLAVVAALIGAGGLGSFVFEGLGQYAVDLVLLGALPAILLALAADFVLQTLATVLRPTR
jgi:osmoprotectant transport system permease protein